MLVKACREKAQINVVQCMTLPTAIVGIQVIANCFFSLICECLLDGWCLSKGMLTQNSNWCLSSRILTSKLFRGGSVLAVTRFQESSIEVQSA